MDWGILILSVLALAALHLWWRARLARTIANCRREIDHARSLCDREIASRDAQQKALLDSMVEGLVVLDNEGRIRLFSRAFCSIFGTSPDLRGKTLMEAVRLHELFDLVASLPEKKQVVGYEMKLSGREERWLDVSAAALTGADGQPEGVLLVCHDLTRLKKLERTRQDFVANVSHELRTPLSMIKGYADTLLEGAKDDPELARKFLQTINRNADRLKLLIEDLRRFRPTLGPRGFGRCVLR